MKSAHEAIVNDGPLAPAVLARLEGFIVRLDQPMTAKRAAARLRHLAEVLESGPPPDDLFERAAAVALWGAFMARSETADRRARRASCPGDVK